jgi:uncharacterized protein YndB with AHSA1/START domain
MENAYLPDNELLFTKDLNAPRELVFDMWTQPEHLSKWWGPNGFSLISHHADIKTGGSWTFTMLGPDGRNYPNKIIFTEVVKPERIIYKHSGEKDMEPVFFETRIYFETAGSMTRLTLNMIFESAAELQRIAKTYGAIEGAEQHLNRLTQYTQSL